MEPKQAVLESSIYYVKIEINGKLELVCVHTYGCYEQVMTQLACSEEKGNTLIIWTNLGFIDLPREYDEQFFEAIVVTEIRTEHLKKTAGLDDF
jgi:hypothetical protein